MEIGVEMNTQVPPAGGPLAVGIAITYFILMSSRRLLDQTWTSNNNRGAVPYR